MHLKDGCGLILQFLGRSLKVETDLASKLLQECSMTLQAFLELLEVVLSVVVPGLTQTTYMPSSLIHIQVFCCPSALSLDLSCDILRMTGHHDGTASPLVLLAEP